MSDFDYDEAIEVTPGIYWIGFHDEIAGLHCNPYLLIDDDEAVLIDPGSIPHFPIVMRKVINTILPSIISTIMVNHQDPDVCGCLPVLEDIIDRDDLIVAGHSICTWLVKHYGIESDLFAVDEHDYRHTLKSGRVLEFAHTPHLHSPGAVVTYDGKTKSLFTGDLFGAASNNWDLMADGGFPQSMESWHQAVMPSGDHLRIGVSALEKFDVERILPQHGSIIEGDKVPVAFEFLKNLQIQNKLDM